MPPDSTTRTRMGKLCEMCGDPGVPSLLLTCPQCKLSRQHFYCLKTYGKGAPNVWICDECEAASIMPPTSVKGNLPEAFMPNSDMVEQDNTCSKGGNKVLKRDKIVKTGKVIYLPAQEVIMLSSRASKIETPPRSKTYSSARPSNIVGSTSARVPVKPMAAPPKSLLQKVKANPTSPPSIRLPPSHIPFRINSADRQQIIQRQKDPTEKNASQTPRKKHIHVGRTQDAPVPCGREENLASKPSFASSTVTPYPLITNSGVEDGIVKTKNSLAENDDQTNIQPNAQKCFLPALDSSWKGSFEIFDSVSLNELNYCFEAHPPSKVRRKVYEFSKRMPKALQFKLLPRYDIWADIFQDECPHEDDIGLYFFSSGAQRSANYIFLSELMEAKDLVMKSYMYGVELWVFPSKLLPAKSQRWNEEYFLWGIFRCIKKDEAAYKLNEELPRLVQPSDCTPDNQACRSGEISGLKKNDMDCSAPLSIPEAEGKQCIQDFPPGFETIYRLKQIQKMLQ